MSRQARAIIRWSAPWCASGSSSIGCFTLDGLAGAGASSGLAPLAAGLAAAECRRSARSAPGRARRMGVSEAALGSSLAVGARPWGRGAAAATGRAWSSAGVVALGVAAAAAAGLTSAAQAVARPPAAGAAARSALVAWASRTPPSAAARSRPPGCSSGPRAAPPARSPRCRPPRGRDPRAQLPARRDAQVDRRVAHVKPIGARDRGRRRAGCPPAARSSRPVERWRSRGWSARRARRRPAPSTSRPPPSARAARDRGGARCDRTSCRAARDRRTAV